VGTGFEMEAKQLQRILRARGASQPSNVEA
jgi:hypothetical protein